MSSSTSPSATTVADLATERLVLRSWTAAGAADVLADRRSDGWASDFPAEGDRVVASRRGYASEATRGLAEHAFTAPGIRVVYADAEMANPASVRVLEEAGFESWPVGTEPGTLRYRLIAPDPSVA